MTVSISSLSKEYVLVPISAREAGVVVDPTQADVQMAFTIDGNPEAGDWEAASWETDNGIYKARCLVGPGGDVQLAPGDYQVWAKLTDNPEVPVKAAGILRVT